MQIYHHNDLTQFQGQNDLVLTIGIFDGCHLGHRLLFDEIKKMSQQLGAKSAVVTFNSADHKPRYRQINHPNLGERLLKECGVEELHLLDFEQNIKDLSAEDFLNEILIKKFRTKGIVLGEDAQLGKNRSTGAVEFLEKASHQGLKTACVPLKQIGGEVISSSRIRCHISSGHFSVVDDLLGYPFTIGGFVVKDQQKARKMGFPTANIPLLNTQYPPHGVYRCRICLDPCEQNEFKKAIAYVGTRPTLLPDSSEAFLEVHIPQWNGCLYDKYVEVSGLKFLRPEMKFSNIDELKSQIQVDLQN
ncbi:MAG: riboflavin biosynthesis protein RibF [Planctomycetes bacterium]|nr:riboflavin biosynthesis protein RibF [Planctomycetota bacterium]